MDWIRLSVMNITAISVVSAIAECAVEQSEQTESLHFLCGTAIMLSVVRMILEMIGELAYF